MRELFASKIVEVSSHLTHLAGIARKQEGNLSPSDRQSLERAVLAVQVYFEDLGLESSLDQIRRIATLLKLSNVAHSEAEAHVSELTRRFADDLGRSLCLIIPRERARFWQENQAFGPDVYNAFPSATYDIEESSKCISVGRSTACVFHLMRVLEVGLRVLAATLKDPRLDPKRNPSWDSILKKCREELEKDRSKRAPEWAADDTFFSGAAASLMAVKDAWRNPTMHVEINYDSERAIDVWNSVRGLMRHLATKLRE